MCVIVFCVTRPKYTCRALREKKTGEKKREILGRLAQRKTEKKESYVNIGIHDPIDGGDVNRGAHNSIHKFPGGCVIIIHSGFSYPVYWIIIGQK